MTTGGRHAARAKLRLDRVGAAAVALTMFAAGCSGGGEPDAGNDAQTTVVAATTEMPEPATTPPSSTPTTTATTATTTPITTSTTTTVALPEVEVEILSDVDLEPATKEAIDQGLAFVAGYTRENTPAAVTIYASPNVDYLIDTYTGVTGFLHETARAALSRPSGGMSAKGYVWLNTADDPELQSDIAAIASHEYYHTLQGAMGGNVNFTSIDYPPWMTEGTAQILTNRNNEYEPGVFYDVEELSASDIGGPFPGLQAWEGPDGGFFNGYNTYGVASALISMYTEEVGLTDDAWAVDLWRNISGANQDWRAAWQQTYGAPVEEFYVWAETTFNTFNTVHAEG